MGGINVAVVQISREAILKYICFICKLILRDPVQNNCGHRFCRSCFLSNIRNDESKLCPQCQIEYPEEVELLSEDKVFVDKAIKREYANLPAKCLETGCDWGGTLGSYESHEISCEFKKVNCQYCSALISLKYVQHHINEDCMEFEVACPKCYSAVPRTLLLNHLELCQINSKDEATQSSAGEVKCAITGCSAVVPRAHISTHKEEAVIDHVDGISQRLILIELKMTKIANDITKTMTINKATDGAGNSTTERFGKDKQNKDAATEGATNEQFIEVANKVQMLENLSAVMNREFKKCLTEMKSLSTDCIELKNRNDKLEVEIKNMERQLMLNDVTLAEQDTRILMLENGFYDGILVWKISEFTRRRQEAVTGKTNSMYSSPFYTGRTGYKLCARIYLNGDGMGKNTHISLFIVVMKGTYDALLRWPFQQKVTLNILDQQGRDHVVDAFQPDTASSSFKRPTSDMNIASGCPLFMPLSYLDMKGRDYVKDDCMFVKVLVDTRDLN